MPVTKKPRASSQARTQSALAETEIQALIEKGGSVAKPEAKEISASKPQLVQLRLTRNVIARIDAIREARLVKIPRHMWLLEAIHEKLVREEENVEKEL